MTSCNKELLCQEALNVMKTPAALQALIQPFDYFPEGSPEHCVPVKTSDSESSRYKSPACHRYVPPRKCTFLSLCLSLLLEVMIHFYV